MHHFFFSGIFHFPASQIAFACLLQAGEVILYSFCSRTLYGFAQQSEPVKGSITKMSCIQERGL
jgi:hypothetical protein